MAQKIPFRDIPFVSFDVVGRRHGIGTGATKTAARRAGVKAVRLPNGRELLTFDAAEKVDAALSEATHPVKG
jgi:hypothetical protein